MHRWFFLALAAALGSGCAHDSSLSSRLTSADELVREVEDELKLANKWIKAGTDFDKAADVLADARTKVEDRRMAFYSDRENLSDRVSQAQTRLSEAKDAKLRRELAVEVPKRKEKAEQLMTAFRSASEELRDRASLNAQKAEQARQASDAATQYLDDSKRFELDETWSAFAQDARRELAERRALLTRAGAVLSFLNGPVAKSAQAQALVDRAKAEAKPEERAALFAQARETYLACAKEAAELFAQTPGLDKEPVSAGGPKATAKSFAASCEAQATAEEKPTPPKASKAKKTGSKQRRKKAEANAQ